MKLFPFQEAFKSGSSVCPHRKFLCFNFPKKEISLRSEPSICLWAELFQETLAAESRKHPWLSAAAGMSGKQLGSHPGGGDPTETGPGPPLPPSSSFSCALSPNPILCNSQSSNPPRGIQCLHFSPRNGPICRLTSIAHMNTLTNRHPTVIQGRCNTKAPFCFPVKIFLVLTDSENQDNLVWVQGWGGVAEQGTLVCLTQNILFWCFPHLPSFFINRIRYHECLHKEGPLPELHFYSCSY